MAVCQSHRGAALVVFVPQKTSRGGERQKKTWLLKRPSQLGASGPSWSGWTQYKEKNQKYRSCMFPAWTCPFSQDPPNTISSDPHAACRPALHHYIHVSCPYKNRHLWFTSISQIRKLRTRELGATPMAPTDPMGPLWHQEPLLNVKTLPQSIPTQK